MTIKGLDQWLTTDPFDHDPPCEMCGRDVDSCLCPECPRCAEVGNPACYQEVDLGICGELYGKETLEQKIAKQEFEITCITEELRDAQQYLDYLNHLKVVRDNPGDPEWIL